MRCPNCNSDHAHEADADLTLYLDTVQRHYERRACVCDECGAVTIYPERANYPYWKQIDLFTTNESEAMR